MIESILLVDRQKEFIIKIMSKQNQCVCCIDLRQKVGRILTLVMRDPKHLQMKHISYLEEEKGDFHRGYQSFKTVADNRKHKAK